MEKWVAQVEPGKDLGLMQCRTFAGTAGRRVVVLVMDETELGALSDIVTACEENVGFTGSLERDVAKAVRS